MPHHEHHEGGSSKHHHDHHPGGNSSKHHHNVVVSSTKNEETPAPVAVKDVFSGKKLFGDLFGSTSSFESLGYRSRVGLIGEPTGAASESSKKAEELEKELQINSANSIGSFEDFRSDSESDNEIDAQLTPKQQLARTIRNWCVMAANDTRVIYEGGVHALIQLSSTDDQLVKKSCASAFYHLSTRESNRANLVNLGAVTGVIAIAMQVRSWQVAKTVAMCLCNLSMEPNGEAIMAKEGAILAIGILMGIKGQRLLPICVHTLYNLTCVDQFYKGMDRIAKALLNILPTAFDHTHFLIKALCNCGRYSWMRLRLIEDGVVNAFLGLVPQISNRLDSDEYVLHMLTCLASLSESSTGCRTDMLQRGTVELLEQLLPHCTNAMCRFYCIKVLHSLLEIVRLMTVPAFETSVNIVVEILHSIIKDESSMVTMKDDFSEPFNALVATETRQYACACLLIFTSEHMRGIPYLYDLAISCLPELLPKDDNLTQFFSVTASGNIFEYNTCKSIRDLNPLLKLVIVGGQHYREPSVIQAVSITLAKLSVEVKYLQLLEKGDLLGRLLEKLLILVEICSFSMTHINAAKKKKSGAKASKMFGGEGGDNDNSRSSSLGNSTHSDLEEAAGSGYNSIPPSRPPSPPHSEDEPPSARFIAHSLGIILDKATVAVVRECACTAITRVALSLGTSLAKNLREQLAKLFTDFLGCDDYSVISNTITGIRSLGERGLCEDELLSNLLFQRVAHIVSTYGSDLSLVRNCCAVLWVFSYNKASHQGLATKQVMDVLFKTTSAEDSMTRELVAATLCNISVDPKARQTMIDMGVVQVLETLSGTTSGLIQELCAKCICNLTCAEDCHKVLIDHQALQVIIMIALLRAVAPTTKLLCAKALLNLTRLGNHKELESAGSIRIFATLSGIDNSDTQHTCARGFLMLSSIHGMRGDIVQRRTVVQALYSLLKSEAAQTRIMAGMAVCNLLACPSTQGPSIQAGGLSVLKIIATMDYEELREATARVIITLLNNPSLHSVLAKEPLTQVLVLIAQQSKPVTFECAIKAFAFMAQSDVFRVQLIDKGCVSALVAAVIAGKIHTSDLAQYVCRCLCLLSYYYTKVEVMVVRCNVLLALHAIYRMGFCAVSTDTCAMIAIILQNFTKAHEVRSHLVEQDALKLLVGVSQHFSHEYILTFRATISFVQGLSQEKSLHIHLVSQGMMTMISHVAKSTRKKNLLTEKDVLHIAMTLNSITATADCHEAMVSTGIVSIIEAISHSLSADSIHEIVAALCNMASSKSCRRYLVEQGAADLIVKLSRSSNRTATHDLCTLALGYLSEITRLNDGIVKKILSLSLHPDDATSNNNNNNSAHNSGRHSGRSTPLTSAQTSARGRGQWEHVQGISLEVPPEEAFLDDDDDDEHHMDNVGLPSGQNTGRSGTNSNSRKQSSKGVMALKKNIVGNIAGLKAKIKESQESFTVKTTNQAAYVSEKDRPKNINRDSVDSELFSLDKEERQLLLVNYGPDSQFSFIEYHASVEPGGMAAKFKINLPLPAISASSFTESSDRTNDLPKFTVDQLSLPKNIDIITDFTALAWGPGGKYDNKGGASDGFVSPDDSRPGSPKSGSPMGEESKKEAYDSFGKAIKSGHERLRRDTMDEPDYDSDIPLNLGGPGGRNKSIMAINALNRGESSKKLLRMDSMNNKGTATITPRAPNVTDKKLSHKALSKMFGVDPTKLIGSTVVPLRRGVGVYSGVDLSNSQRSVHSDKVKSLNSSQNDLTNITSMSPKAMDDLLTSLTSSQKNAPHRRGSKFLGVPGVISGPDALQVSELL